jgi:hypothetical protein
MSPEQLAELFHSTYERLAPAFGWRTKKGCNVPFAQLPQRNKALMVATCQTVLNALQECGAVANGSQQPQPAMCLGCEYWRMPSGGHCMRGEGVEFCFKVGTHAGVR